MALFADRCHGLCTGITNCCQDCRDLRRNERLEEILSRMEHGIYENAPFIYHGIDSLIHLLQRKNERIDFYQLKGLNQAHSLLRKARALDNHKRFVIAIASGNVSSYRLPWIKKKGSGRSWNCWMKRLKGYTNPRATLRRRQ